MKTVRPMGAHERTEFLARLGQTVRARRDGLGLSRRELSTHAGVSERFLVQLESGSGNISVARLQDVARAMGTSAAALLGGETQVARSTMGERVVALLGLRGAGKSTVGRRAAEKLGVRFVELDALVEARAGTSLREVFELHGTEFYRRIERETLRGFLATKEPAVVATGGGIVTDHETFDALKRATKTVWLRAKPEDHWQRVVAQGDARPMANRGDAMEDLRRLLRARGPLYEQADLVVDTSALGIDGAVDAVVRAARG